MEARVLVLGGPRLKFTSAEFDCIKQYLSKGGSLLVMMGEGGESRFDTNVNFLLEEWGIMVNTGEYLPNLLTFPPLITPIP